jgi:hypothetical protein
VNEAWVTLDATPSLDRQSLVERLGHRNLWQAANDLISNTWSTYVVNMTASRQDESIYGPLKDVLRGSLGAFLASPAMRITEIFERSRNVLSSPRRWLSVEGGVTVFVLLICLAALIWLVRRVLSLTSSLRSQGGRRRRARQRVEFLERFIRLMNLRGIQNQESETPREFAHVSQRTLAAELARAELTSFPADLTELYYRVRFGDEPLSDDEDSAVNEKLDRLEKSLNDR